ncbi:MAG: hypothetical protein IJ665_08875 [Phocaeicola sp.]|nr:hypothetical protein [Phocaeicola sp.]
MKKFLFLLLVLSLPLSTYAQCNEKTKTMVEELKKNITYPKYNIGDTLYIAFINNVDADINSLSDKDIDVNRVVICDISVCNGNNFRSSNSEPGLFLGLNSIGEIEWIYQIVDATIIKPKVRDLSKVFYSESCFSETKEGAIKNLKESHKE